MPITKIVDSQWPLVRAASMTVTNMGAGNGASFVVPPNSMVLRVAVQTATAFNSGTTATATVTDGTTVYANAVDVLTAGAETVTNAPKFYPTGGTITASLAQTGAAATAGNVIVVIEHVVLGRGNEITE